MTRIRLLAATLILPILILLGGWQDASAAPSTVKVKGEFTYYGDKNQSREQCRVQALEGARIQALAREFGTIVSQDIYQHETMSDRDTSTYFSSLSSTSVKGEWLADDGEPRFTYALDDDGCYVVTCTVSGVARALSNEAVEFDARVLRNGTDLRAADTHFRSGDDMYLYFRAPSAGYVACYLADDKGTVYAMLPYLESHDTDVRVRADRDYIFFSPAHADRDHGTVDECQLITDDVERNSLYVVYSPERFSRAMDSRVSDLVPRTLPREEFSRWLAKARRNDPRMNVKVMNLEIIK